MDRSADPQPSTIGPRLAQPGGGPQTTIIMALVVAALYVGRQIFIPLALAVLLSFMLAPLVSWLERMRVPKIAAVVGPVTLALIVIFSFGFVVTGQLTELARGVPQYETNLQAKIKAIKDSGGPAAFLGQATEMLQQLGREVAQPAGPVGPAATSQPSAETAKPMPVRIEQPAPTPLEILQSVVGPLIEPLVTAGIVVVFMIFMLLQRHDIRDRFIRLAGVGDLDRTTRALEDASQRVAHYLSMQLAVNVTYGIPIGVGLWVIGVPNPLLWGMVATIFRFVPYIGPILAAIVPITLSMAVDTGWTMLLWTAALFIVVEPVTANIVEPRLYGSMTGLSPLAIVVAAIFWTWLWGPIGLIVSTPLTVCAVVLGRHVPQFTFLNVLLGSEPVLSPAESLHQRLLAADPEEATQRAEDFLKDHSLETFYGDVAIPALVEIERDRAIGILDDDRRKLAADGMLTLIDNLSGYEDLLSADAKAAGELASVTPGPNANELGSEWRQRPVLCVGARGNLDDVAATILAQLLERRGLKGRTLSFAEVSPARLSSVDTMGVRIVCFCYMNENSIAHARYLIRRFRRRAPDIPVLVGFWSMPADQSSCRAALEGTGADLVAVSLVDTLDQISTQGPMLSRLTEGSPDVIAPTKSGGP